MAVGADTCCTALSHNQKRTPPAHRIDLVEGTGCNNRAREHSPAELELPLLEVDQHPAAVEHFAVTAGMLQH